MSLMAGTRSPCQDRNNSFAVRLRCVLNGLIMVEILIRIIERKDLVSRIGALFSRSAVSTLWVALPVTYGFCEACGSLLRLVYEVFD